MSSGESCRECGTAISVDSPGGFCAQCLLGLGLTKASEKTVLIPESKGEVTALPTEKPGDRIGRYRLLQEIGHGGCGVVYMAEQEAPVRRKVALKVIKLGMDTRQVVARFEAERQALALMDHSSIAKVLDAGATDTGRPFFVMELVGGIKITDYCNQNQLTTRHRLDLFIQVCLAVQHAHQKGVIHRDLKPSNVLVAIQDGVPVPKVIDFGIAKATQGRLTDQTVFTAFEQFLGTPAYMSPEQAQLGGLDIDTRSDIYSLGVLLYELLTGGTPFDTKELVAAGLDEMRRTIREVEPVKPSTRLTQTLVAVDVSQLKSHGRSKDSDRADSRRLLQVKELIHSVRGDLDWIVMKCLEKDRSRRYETANGLARDIERHLNQEPIVARPPNTIYRIHKFIRRNRLMAAAATAIATVLVLGIAGSTWQAAEQNRLRQQAQLAQANESREREKAQTEAAKSQQVAQFLTDMVRGVGPSVAAGRDTTLLREILDRTADRVANDLTNQPQVAVELENTIGRVYLALGEVAKAERMHSDALAKAKRFLGNDHPGVVLSLLGLALARGAQGKLAEAEALDQEALTLCRAHFPRGLFADSLNDLSRVLERQGKQDEADLLQQEALDLHRRIWGEQSEAVALSLRNLGIIRSGQGRQGEAEKLMIEGLAIMRKAGTSPNIAWSLTELAKVFMQQDKLSAAEAALKETLVLQRAIYGETHPTVRDTLLGLGDLLARDGKPAEAEINARAAIGIHRKRPQEEREDPNMSFWIGAVFQKMGNLGEAEEWYRQALLDESKAPRLLPRTYISLVHALVSVLAVEKKSCEIEAAYADWLREVRVRLRPEDHALTAHLLYDVAGVLLEGKKFTEGEQLAGECLALREKNLPDDWRTDLTRNLLGACLLGQERYAEAEPLLLAGYEGMKLHEANIPAQSKPRLKEVLQRLTQLYEATDRPDPAAEYRQRLVELERVLPSTQNVVPPTVKPSP